ncbi:hypothetical protein MRB53_039325 [Persea americana]|nr:hypothetical protein MRB53_039325 [Persea americana]
MAHEFRTPEKLIHSEEDVARFHKSPAYQDITDFINVLCQSVTGQVIVLTTSDPALQSVLNLLLTCTSWIDQCPPRDGARRFGNAAFRDWHSLLETQARDLLSSLNLGEAVNCLDELLPYFTGSFGSAQRLDYGTGHELSFIAFLGALFKLRILSAANANHVRDVALTVFPAYLTLIQRLITIYTLEPAGSHGVWGLDDHFAIPYLLGSAQLSDSEPDAFPNPGTITNKKDVEELRQRNLYFNAIGFINDVKTGPFWEHSPMLYDISGVNNWQKIARGSTLKADTDNDSIQEGIADLKQAQDGTRDLVVSEFAADREALDADTPLPDDEPQTG